MTSNTGSGRPRRGRPAGKAVPRRAGTPTQARLLAARVLERVERAGAYADLALHAALRRSPLAPRDRAFVTELVYGTLRWRGRLDYLLGFALERDFQKLEPLVATVLRLGAYQIVMDASVPDSAAVDQTVHCARALGAERAAGLVNAVLRRLARERDRIPLPALAEDPVGHLTHALSLPSWIAERWVELFGAEEAAALAEASNQVPPLTARVNGTRTGREALLEEIRGRLPEARPCRHAPLGIELGHSGNPGLDPAFQAGLFTIQDEASQLVVELLDPRPGERILDLCAAPGAKATAAAERVGPTGSVLAVDRNARRLALVGRACRRLGLANVTTRVADACQLAAALPDVASTAFDRVLVDVPCSGLGTLRRNPDARWRLRPADIGRLAATQGALLRAGASVLRPGGTLVYSTCTVLPEENERVVADFLAEAPGFQPASHGQVPAAVAPFIAPPPQGDGTMHTWPHRHGMDGFFAARLEKRP